MSVGTIGDYVVYPRTDGRSGLDPITRVFWWTKGNADAWSGLSKSVDMISQLVSLQYLNISTQGMEYCRTVQQIARSGLSAFSLTTWGDPLVKTKNDGADVVKLVRNLLDTAVASCRLTMLFCAPEWIKPLTNCTTGMKGVIDAVDLRKNFSEEKKFQNLLVVNTTASADCNTAVEERLNALSWKTYNLALSVLASFATMAKLAYETFFVAAIMPELALGITAVSLLSSMCSLANLYALETSSQKLEKLK